LILKKIHLQFELLLFRVCSGLQLFILSDLLSVNFVELIYFAAQIIHLFNVDLIEILEFALQILWCLLLLVAQLSQCDLQFSFFFFELLYLWFLLTLAMSHRLLILPTLLQNSLVLLPLLLSNALYLLFQFTYFLALWNCNALLFLSLYNWNSLQFLSDSFFLFFQLADLILSLLLSQLQFRENLLLFVLLRSELLEDGLEIVVFLVEVLHFLL
jgi:hypothetical protein